MIEINDTTDRATLEIAAIFECDFALDAIERASDADLLEMVLNWINDGDECASA